MVKKARELPSLQNLPAGVHQVAAGEVEFMMELFAGFGQAMVIGILCIYLLLVLLFREFLQPITILSALPPSAGGALFFLFITGYEMSVPSLIGMLMLMGIVTKNSILLVEYAVRAMHERHVALRRDDGCVLEASAADRHDDDRDGRGHVADRDRLVRRSELPCADGRRGDRRTVRVDGAEPVRRAGVVHDHRRPAAEAAAQFRAVQEAGFQPPDASLQKILQLADLALGERRQHPAPDCFTDDPGLIQLLAAARGDEPAIGACARRMRPALELPVAFHAMQDGVHRLRRHRAATRQFRTRQARLRIDGVQRRQVSKGQFDAPAAQAFVDCLT